MTWIITACVFLAGIAVGVILGGVFAIVIVARVIAWAAKRQQRTTPPLHPTVTVPRPGTN